MIEETLQSVIDSGENVEAGIIEEMTMKFGDENENDEEEALEKLIYKVWLGISSDIVSDLASNNPENQNLTLFFDNWPKTKGYIICWYNPGQ